MYTRTDTELHKLTDKRGFELTLSLFKNKLATLETILYFDKKQFLREKTDDPAQLKIIIEDALQLVKEVSNEQDRFFLKGTIGNLYRICERPQTALVYLNECLLFAQESGTTTQQIVSLIRVGEALKYNEEYEKALILFNQALSLCQMHEVTAYTDFSLQHKGKCLMEQGYLIDAEMCFNEALLIRLEKGNAALIDSTEQALALLMQLKN